jgi:hypothetical protein
VSDGLNWPSMAEAAFRRKDTPLPDDARPSIAQTVVGHAVDPECAGRTSPSDWPPRDAASACPMARTPPRKSAISEPLRSLGRWPSCQLSVSLLRFVEKFVHQSGGLSMPHTG